MVNEDRAGSVSVRTDRRFADTKPIPVTCRFSDVSPSRRQVLGFGAALLSAGCSATDPTKSDDCHSGFHVSAEEFEPATDLVADLDEEGRAIVAEAVEAKSVERTTYGQESLRDGVFVEYDGAVYETRVSTAEVESVAAYRLNVEWEEGQEPPGDATVVGFAELPEADQKVLDLAVYGGDERREHPTESLSVDDFPAPYPDGGDSSKLVTGNVTWVRWNDRPYRVEVGGSATKERRTFEYEVERVATNPKEFRTVAASRYRIDLTDLSPDEREIVLKALEDTYEECSPASDALESLQSRLSDDQRLPHPAEGWYVRFDGGEYRLSIVRWEA